MSETTYNNDISGSTKLTKMVLQQNNKNLKKLKLNPLISLAGVLDIKVKKFKPNGKSTNKTKTELINDIEYKMKLLPIEEIIEILKTEKIGIELEVKHLLESNIDIDDLVKLDICLPIKKLFEENPKLQELFSETCDLENINDTIKSNNCLAVQLQGLYILTISKNNIDYIIKLGSFAESQGMSKRICSFGGGNYETGSLTNKWFQRFIKKAIEQGYTSKFTYNNRNQEKIKILNLDGDTIEMVPYIMRPLESELFKKYNKINCNISPIFGSNCL